MLRHVGIGAGDEDAELRELRASDVQIFWPLTTYSSPSRTARVPRLARSLPAPGSLNSWHQISSPASIGER